MLTTLFNIYESKWCMASSTVLSGFSRPYFVWCTLAPRTWVCSDHARFYLVWCDFLNRHFSNHHRCTQVGNPGGWFSQILGGRCRWCIGVANEIQQFFFCFCFNLISCCISYPSHVNISVLAVLFQKFICFSQGIRKPFTGCNLLKDLKRYSLGSKTLIYFTWLLLPSNKIALSCILIYFLIINYYNFLIYLLSLQF
jgi:hypothetical protein